MCLGPFRVFEKLFTNTFWLYQLGIKNALFQCYCHFFKLQGTSVGGSIVLLQYVLAFQTKEYVWNRLLRAESCVFEKLQMQMNFHEC